MNYIDELPFTDTIKNKLNSILCYVRETIDVLDSMILFGSYARCENTVKSDLDILILTETPLSVELRGDLTSAFDDVDIVIYDKEAFKVSDCLLAKQIRKDGVLLWKV